MARINQAVNSSLHDRLTSEIDRLTEQQIEALRTATLAGMTEDEVREYEHRRKQIAELVGQFKLLMPRRPI